MEEVAQYKELANAYDAYEKLKDLTRGKKIDAVAVREFINGLDLPDAEKQQLLALTPHNYIGLATQLF